MSPKEVFESDIIAENIFVDGCFDGCSHPFVGILMLDVVVVFGRVVVYRLLYKVGDGFRQTCGGLVLVDGNVGARWSE